MWNKPDKERLDKIPGHYMKISMINEYKTRNFNSKKGGYHGLYTGI